MCGSGIGKKYFLYVRFIVVVRFCVARSLGVGRCRYIR